MMNDINIVEDNKETDLMSIRPNNCDSCGRVPSFVQDRNGHFVICICGERSQHMKTRKESILMWNHDHTGFKQPEWTKDANDHNW
jgi:hypothetical protein